MILLATCIIVQCHLMSTIVYKYNYDSFISEKIATESDDDDDES